MNGIKNNELIAFVVGIIVGGLFANLFIFGSDDYPHAVNEHQITQPDDEYHVHADFLIYVNDQKVNLSEDKYMTNSHNELHQDAHLHDGNGEVKHIHGTNITFAEFLESLDMSLNSECLLLEGDEYCSNDKNVLALYVNFEPYNSLITEYVPVDDDSILLYYGDFDPEKITDYMNEVKDDACYYSGTCPERGVAPPESCGLTCEI